MSGNPITCSGSLTKFEHSRNVGRLKRALHLQMNLKENTRPSLLSRSQDGILSKALTELDGRVTCTYPDWLERRMTAFRIWKGQFSKPRKNGMTVEWLYGVTHQWHGKK